jgi:arginyl-tRNA synthetase
MVAARPLMSGGIGTTSMKFSKRKGDADFVTTLTRTMMTSSSLANNYGDGGLAATAVPSSSSIILGKGELRRHVISVLETLVDPALLPSSSSPTSSSSSSKSNAMMYVAPATKSEFGDYQINAAMSLYQRSDGKYANPRQLSTRIMELLTPRLHGAATLEIAGPGFVNVRWTDDHLCKMVGGMSMESEGRLGVPTTADKKKIVVDFSSPNIAKEMHVGHLRSTIIGDTLANVLSFVGHDVVRLNHVGDWGTQFGMLVEHMRDEYPTALTIGRDNANAKVDLGDLVTLYKAAKKRFDIDDGFKQRARDGVVKLQGGDVESLAAWETLCDASRVEYQKIYDRLSIVGLTERGESYYNQYLDDLVSDLSVSGLAVESDGAMAVFLEGYANRDGTPLPMIVRKTDGGYNYAATDLAAIRQRVLLDADKGGEKADRVLYVTDSGQSQHFDMVFAAAKKAGYVPEHISLEHVPFGLVQGEDGKKFATRSGDTVKLKDLLDEAVRIAGEDIRSRIVVEDDKNNEGATALATTSSFDEVARTVGIGAVKYADLSMNRESNYKFSYGRMLSLNGNTAPYMLYAYARICGIVRRATGQSEGTKLVWPKPASMILIEHDSERQLMRNLVKLPDILGEVESDLYPNRLCDYLFETSQKFNQFYENCSVNNAETLELKASRLSLCTVSAATIRLLMNLLGISVVEKL